MDFREFLTQGFVILDGASGSNLQRAGMQSGDCPELWITEHPDIFIDLQKQYILAGADVLYTPTFTSTSIKLSEYGLEDRQEELIHRLVGLTKEAVRQSGTDRRIYLLGDISMTGVQLEPVGSYPFEELVKVYKQQAALLVEAGVDGFAIETMMSLQECRAALLAVKETCDLPVMVTLTYQPDGRTLYGTNPETAVVVLQAMGADAVGINCSAGPDRMVEAVKKMAEYATVPIVTKPNAGLPQLEEGRTVYDMEAGTFAECMMDIVDAGATVLGGCCGTTPEYIRLLKERTASKTFSLPGNKPVRALTTERNLTPIHLSGNFMIIGERINPTGKKALQAELREGSLDMVMDMAEEQVAQGAQILDVNMGMNGKIELGDDVVVIGIGIMGALHIQLAKLKGARVIACELDEKRLEVAKKMGADVLINSGETDAVEEVKRLTDGRGADAVFCTVPVASLAKQGEAAVQIYAPP